MGTHRWWPADSTHKGPITRKCFDLMTSSWMKPLRCCNIGYPSSTYFKYLVQSKISILCIQSTVVSLSCSVRNFKMVEQLQSRTNDVSRDLNLRWFSEGNSILLPSLNTWHFTLSVFWHLHIFIESHHDEYSTHRSNFNKHSVQTLTFPHCSICHVRSASFSFRRQVPHNTNVSSVV